MYVQCWAEDDIDSSFLSLLRQQQFQLEWRMDVVIEQRLERKLSCLYLSWTSWPEMSVQMPVWVGISSVHKLVTVWSPFLWCQSVAWCDFHSSRPFSVAWKSVGKYRAQSQGALSLQFSRVLPIVWLRVSEPAGQKTGIHLHATPHDSAFTSLPCLWPWFLPSPVILSMIVCTLFLLRK